MKKKYIICICQSGIGNSLFQIVSVSAFSEMKSYKVIILFGKRKGLYKKDNQDAINFIRSFTNVLVFRSDLMSFFLKFSSRISKLFPSLVLMRSEQSLNYDSQLFSELNSTFNIIHSSHMMDEKYFSKSKYFKSLKLKISGNNRINICFIHVRVYESDIDLYHLSDLKEYYIKAISDINLIDPTVKFFFSSNKMKVAKEFLNSLGLGFDFINISELKAMNASDDFIFMARSRFIVCSNSTYSWWAAKLSNAEASYFPKSFGGDNKMDHLITNFKELR